MNESQWDEKFRTFLKKTGDDLKRAGNDIRVEAEKLMKEVKDPDRQDKVKKGLETFKVWARKTAEEVAGVVETGMKKAENVVRTTVDAPGSPISTEPEGSSPTAEPHDPVTPDVQPMRHDTPVNEIPAVDAAPPPAKKTMGSSKKKTPAKKASGGSKKPLGKKRSP